MVFTEILKLSAISLLLIPLSTSLKTSISLAVSRSLRVEVIVNGFSVSRKQSHVDGENLELDSIWQTGYRD